MGEKIKFIEKPFLTLKEASEYFNVGINRLRRITTENEKFVIYVGTKRLIKREIFEKYLLQEYSI